MNEQNVTVGEFVAEAEAVISRIDPEFSYRRADLYGFVSGAWPYDGTPADAACEFAAAVKGQRDEQHSGGPAGPGRAEMVYTVTGADLVRLDEVTDVREVVAECGPDDCEELTRQLAEGSARVLPGRLAGWGRDSTVRDADGNYYHADIEVD